MKFVEVVEHSITWTFDHYVTHIYAVVKHYIAQSLGACIIKLNTAIIYSFRNKLECLSLTTLSSLI